MISFRDIIKTKKKKYHRTKEIGIKTLEAK